MAASPFERPTREVEGKGMCVLSIAICCIEASVTRWEMRHGHEGNV